MRRIKIPTIDLIFHPSFEMDWIELIKDPVSFSSQKQEIFEHKKLPKVKDAVSVTFRIRLKTHSNDWATIFHKGMQGFRRRDY